jgi:hypothetical protein
MNEGEPKAQPPGMPRLDKVERSPPWDQDEAEWLVGKYVLVGITNIASDGKTVKSQFQYHGRVTRAERGVGFTIECDGARAGQTMVVPPDLRAFHLADRGEYKLRTTGEVVSNPDLVATWSVFERSTS